MSVAGTISVRRPMARGTSFRTRCTMTRTMTVVWTVTVVVTVVWTMTVVVTVVWTMVVAVARSGRTCGRTRRSVVGRCYASGTRGLVVGALMIAAVAGTVTVVAGTVGGTRGLRRTSGIVLFAAAFGCECVRAHKCKANKRREKEAGNLFHNTCVFKYSSDTMTRAQ